MHGLNIDDPVNIIIIIAQLMYTLSLHVVMNATISI